MTAILSPDREHLPEIIKIERECFSPPWTEQSISAELESPDSFFRAAFENGELAGFCIARKAGEDAELYQVAVTRGARRRGLAFALVKLMLCWARESGTSRVLLEVRESNLPAMALYERVGFHSLCRRKNYYTAPAEDAVIMEFDVSSWDGGACECSRREGK